VRIWLKSGCFCQVNNGVFDGWTLFDDNYSAAFYARQVVMVMAKSAGKLQLVFPAYL
jgi:hypothetical protein